MKKLLGIGVAAVLVWLFWQSVLSGFVSLVTSNAIPIAIGGFLLAGLLGIIPWTRHHMKPMIVGVLVFVVAVGAAPIVLPALLHQSPAMGQESVSLTAWAINAVSQRLP